LRICLDSRKAHSKKIAVQENKNCVKILMFVLNKLFEVNLSTLFCKGPVHDHKHNIISVRRAGTLCVTLLGCKIYYDRKVTHKVPDSLNINYVYDQKPGYKIYYDRKLVYLSLSVTPTKAHTYKTICSYSAFCLK
jgi:hypothetical protein